VARILIVGGGCRGRSLAEQMVAEGHAVRASTRSEDGRAAIETVGAECWIGTPDRLATLRGALENVTIACWLLAEAHGEAEQVAALHGSRLEFFLSQAIDTTVRGLIYDATPPADSSLGGVVTADALATGEQIFDSLTQLNAIPAVVLRGDGGGAAVAGQQAWVDDAAGAVTSLLAAR
jgi:hypothetical protein